MWQYSLETNKWPPYLLTTYIYIWIPERNIYIFIFIYILSGIHPLKMESASASCSIPALHAYHTLFGFFVIQKAKEYRYPTFWMSSCLRTHWKGIWNMSQMLNYLEGPGILKVIKRKAQWLDLSTYFFNSYYKYYIWAKNSDIYISCQINAPKFCALVYGSSSISPLDKLR